VNNNPFDDLDAMIYNGEIVPDFEWPNYYDALTHLVLQDPLLFSALSIARQSGLSAEKTLVMMLYVVMKSNKELRDVAMTFFEDMPPTRLINSIQ
jgi:hypothetical protein